MPKQNIGIIFNPLSRPFRPERVFFANITWGFARGASPQAVISRAFSPKIVQTPLPFKFCDGTTLFFTVG